MSTSKQLEFNPQNKIGYIKKEIYRKLFHLLALIIPASFCIFGDVVIYFFAFLLLLVVVVEKSRHYSQNILLLFNKIFLPVLRDNEINLRHFTGTAPMLLSSIICMLWFPSHIFIMSFVGFIFGDLTSALVGKIFGHIYLVGYKTLEGTIAFFVFCGLAQFVSGFALFGTNEQFIYSIILSSLVGAITELYSNKIKCDDNFLVPITICITMAIIVA